MYLTLQVICITSTGESVCMCVCLCCSVAVKNTTSLSTAVCRIVHTVSEGSGGPLRGDLGLQWWFLVLQGGLSLPSVSRALMQLLLVVSLWYYQLRLLLKTHNSRTGNRKSTGGGQPSVTGQSSREETVWHTIGVIMINKGRSRRKEKVNSCVFSFFLSFSPLHNKK